MLIFLKTMTNMSEVPHSSRSSTNLEYEISVASEARCTLVFFQPNQPAAAPMCPGPGAFRCRSYGGHKRRYMAHLMMKPIKPRLRQIGLAGTGFFGRGWAAQKRTLRTLGVFYRPSPPSGLTDADDGKKDEETRRNTKKHEETLRHSTSASTLANYAT